MRRAPRRKATRPLWKVLVLANSRRSEHKAGKQTLAAVQSGLETPIASDEPRHEILADSQSLALGKPVGVAEEDIDRNRIDLIVRNSTLFQIRLERVAVRRIHVPVRPRAQEHARGHVLAPERHGPSYDRGRNAVFAGV